MPPNTSNSATQMPKSREIGEQTALLGQSIDELQSVFGHLFDQLQPVLALDKPANPENSKVPLETAIAPHAEQLRSMRRGIQNIIATVNVLRERVQL